MKGNPVLNCSVMFLLAALASMFGFAFVPMTAADTFTFQQGVNGYNRAQDTSIRWAYTTNFGDSAEIDLDHGGDPGAYEMWSTGSGRASVLEVGNFFQRELGSSDGGSTLEAGATYRYSRMFIRFRDVFGTSPGQVPPGADITTATLKLFNTEDLGAVKAAGSAAFDDPTTGLGGTTIANPQGQPRLNSGTIAIYPSLIPITYGFDDGVAAKGRVTARDRRRGKIAWAQGACASSLYIGAGPHGSVASMLAPNDGFRSAFLWGPADFNNPCIGEGENENDSSHPGAIEVFQDAVEEFKEFDVTGLVDFITGDGVYMTALSPEGELPTLEVNYGNAYRSSEFGDIYDRDGNLLSTASVENAATRPILVIKLDVSQLPGDANGDGVVDVADLGVLGANFNQSNMAFSDGDFNVDGLVDVADLGILGANWTASQITGNASALVPEPTTLLYLVAGVLNYGRCRRSFLATLGQS